MSKGIRNLREEMGRAEQTTQLLEIINLKIQLSRRNQIFDICQIYIIKVFFVILKNIPTPICEQDFSILNNIILFFIINRYNYDYKSFQVQTRRVPSSLPESNRPVVHSNNNNRNNNNSNNKSDDNDNDNINNKINR